MTCEVGGQVLQTTQVVVDRGQVEQPDLGVCTGATAATPRRQPLAPTPPSAARLGCVAGRRLPLRRGARRSGRGVAFAFARAASSGR